MPIDKEFGGSITLTTGYEVKFDVEDMTHTMNHLSLAIVGELSNKHLFQCDNPSSEEFQRAIVEEIAHIMTTQVADEETASHLMTNMLFWHLTDRFFADMAVSIHMNEEVRGRFLKRDWTLITNPAGDSDNGEGGPSKGN